MSSRYATIAREYAESVVVGDILVCRWVKQACQQLLQFPNTLSKRLICIDLSNFP